MNEDAERDTRRIATDADIILARQQDAEREAYRRGVRATVRAIKPWRYGACPYPEMVYVPDCDWPTRCKLCWHHAANGGEWPKGGDDAN
jgi:hypothetical protein